MKGNFAASGEILKHLLLPQLEVLMPDIQSFEAVELLLIALGTIYVLAKHFPERVHLLLCELPVVPFAIQRCVSFISLDQHGLQEVVEEQGWEFEDQVFGVGGVLVLALDVLIQLLEHRLVDL